MDSTLISKATKLYIPRHNVTIILQNINANLTLMIYSNKIIKFEILIRHSKC